MIRRGKLVMIGGPFLITSKVAFLFVREFFFTTCALFKKGQTSTGAEWKKLPINPKLSHGKLLAVSGTACVYFFICAENIV